MFKPIRIDSLKRSDCETAKPDFDGLVRLHAWEQRQVLFSSTLNMLNAVPTKFLVAYDLGNFTVFFEN